MTPAPATPSVPLPKVLATVVVRSAYQGDSHGGAFLVDLESGAAEQKLDWNDGAIDWQGRGGDRGLRGIAFRGPEIFIAASDEVFVFDRDFRKLRSFRNRYLKLCHEICIAGDRLYLTSTGFDSVLAFDIPSETFIEGFCLRRDPGDGRLLFRRFDPRDADGPSPEDTTHLNMVSSDGDRLFVGGVRLDRLIEIHQGRAQAYARLPSWTHNARPFREGTIANSTEADAVCWFDREGREHWRSPVPTYPRDQLAHADLPRDHARPSFGRGLALLGGDLLVGGSSPATLAVHRIGSSKPLKQVTLTLDVRHAIHGLAVWPY